MESLYQNWNEWKKLHLERKGVRPDYSLDLWIKKVNDFGDDVSSFVGKAKEADKELDNEINNKKKKEEDEEKEKESDSKPEVSKPDSELKQEKTAWSKFKKAKERQKKDQDSTVSS